MQVLFEHPAGSLDPRMRLGQIVGERLAVHAIGLAQQRRLQVEEILKRVGLPRDAADRRPYQFRQRRRIGIAHALVLRSELIVAGEPVSALDVSVQSLILNLLADRKRTVDVTYLLIAHDLAVVKYISDRTAVMYLGKVGDLANCEDLYPRHRHPYTIALLSALGPHGCRRDRIVLSGDVPTAVGPPSGCRFRICCPAAQPLCSERESPLELQDDGHLKRCHFSATAQSEREGARSSGGERRGP